MYKSDIEIAQENEMLPIDDIAAKAGIDDKYVEHYGKYKAKIDLSLLKESERPDGKLILVTAITPTPAGEGKTTTTVGLADGLQKIGKNVVVALREPSLGPVFGIKGGAAGGGYAQVVPMEDINLHFTGDMHAIGAANNLLAAMLDNHIQQGNELGIDPRSVIWKRCLDMNDRVLRNIVVGLGKKADGVVREDHFVITVASEIMAILCLASDIIDHGITLAGGGDAKEEGRMVTTPLPATGEDSGGDALVEERQQRVAELTREQEELLASVRATVAALPRPDPERLAAGDEEAKAQEELSIHQRHREIPLRFSCHSFPTWRNC